MPLTTRTYDLREEADRIDGELDGLAETIYDLNEQADREREQGDTDEASDATTENLQEKVGEYRDLENQLDGLLWTIEEHGTDSDPEVRADGGTRADTAGESDGDDGLVEVDGSKVPKHVADAQDDSTDAQADAGGAPDDTGTGTSPDEGASDETDTDAGDPLRVTVKALSFGERAEANDLVFEAEQQKQQTGQGGTTRAMADVFEAGAALQSATFLDVAEKTVEQRVAIIREQHEGFGTWLNRQVSDLSSPSEDRRANLSQRLETIGAERATGDHEPS